MDKCRDIGLYEPISLYAHVPFCRQLCWYCGCAMRVENAYGRTTSYVDALISEISTAAVMLEGRGRSSGLHFGGGTPNYLLADDLGRIIRAVEDQLGLTDLASLSIELDPRLLRKPVIDQLAALGFNRFSFGIQDFDPDVQTAINRVQGFELVEACVSDSRAAGIDDISFDLLYGLPRQTTESFAKTLYKVIALGPDRVSVFGYAHLPTAFRHQRMIDPDDLPDADLRADLAILADELLIAAGYRRIGFDHYARPGNPLAKAAAHGRLKRNFQGFTDDPAGSLLGFGATAISFVDGLYAQNEKRIGAYVDRIRNAGSAVVRGLSRTKRDEATAAVIADLLCCLQADVRPILSRASPSETLRICAALEQFEADGVIVWSHDRIEIAEDAYLLARAVAAALDGRAAPSARMSVAV